MSRDNSQNGIAVVETVLALVAVALVAFIGWYVWTTSADTNTTYDASSASSNQIVKKKQPSKVAEGTQCVIGADKKLGVRTSLQGSVFTFCAPYGWVFNYTDGNMANFFVPTSGLTYDAAKKPEFKEVGGSDGGSPYAILYRKPSQIDREEYAKYQSVTPPELVDAKNLKISAYYHLTGKNDPIGAGLDYQPQGTKQYRYLVEKTDGTGGAVEVSYDIAPGESAAPTLFTQLVSNIGLSKD